MIRIKSNHKKNPGMAHTHTHTHTHIKHILKVNSVEVEEHVLTGVRKVRYICMKLKLLKLSCIEMEEHILITLMN
jgi:hypothetical protein